MSAISFLSQIRKGTSSKSSRVVKELVNELSKNRAQNTVIEDEGLTDIGKTTKGRAILEQKLIYSRKITILPTHKVPEEPDGQFLVLWLKANHTGLFLKDSSKFNRTVDDLEGGGGGSSTTIVKVNNNKHLCLVDAGGLDLGYIGQKDGVNSISAWDLNGSDESAQIIDVVDNMRLRIKDTVIGFSIAAWVKITSFDLHNGIERRIVAKTDDSTNAYALFVTPTQKAVFAVKHAGTQYKVETPATLAVDTWYFIAATFKSSATKEARIYLNGTVSTTVYADTVTYPDLTYLPSTNIQLFTNGIARIIDPLTTDAPPPWDFDTGDFDGLVRDIRIWREKILTQQQVTNFNANRVSITNLALDQSYIAGFIYAPTAIGTLSSATSTSATSTSATTP